MGIKMRDFFSEGLLYLDLMEIYGSSRLVGEICGIAQSNAYRGAQACAKLLKLELVKRGGSYVAEKNLDVQRDLRIVAQRLRARESGLLRLISDPMVPIDQAPKEIEGLTFQIPKHWLSVEKTLHLISAGLIDIVIGRWLDMSAALKLGSFIEASQPIASNQYGLLGFTPFDLQLYTDPEHPLQKQGAPSGALQSFPSPALHVDTGSRLKETYQEAGLWSRMLSDRWLEPGAWESMVGDRTMMIPSSSFGVAYAKRLNPNLKIAQLMIKSTIKDQLLIVFPIGLSREPCMKQAVRVLHNWLADVA